MAMRCVSFHSLQNFRQCNDSGLLGLKWLKTHLLWNLRLPRKANKRLTTTSAPISCCQTECDNTGLAIVENKQSVTSPVCAAFFEVRNITLRNFISPLSSLYTILSEKRRCKSLAVDSFASLCLQTHPRFQTLFRVQFLLLQGTTWFSFFLSKSFGKSKKHVQNNCESDHLQVVHESFIPNNPNMQNVQRYSAFAILTRIFLKCLKMRINLIVVVSILWYDVSRISNKQRNFFHPLSEKF